MQRFMTAGDTFRDDDPEYDMVAASARRARFTERELKRAGQPPAVRPERRMARDVLAVIGASTLIAAGVGLANKLDLLPDGNGSDAARVEHSDIRSRAAHNANPDAVRATGTVGPIYTSPNQLSK